MKNALWQMQVALFVAKKIKSKKSSDCNEEKHALFNKKNKFCVARSFLLMELWLVIFVSALFAKQISMMKLIILKLVMMVKFFDVVLDLITKFCNILMLI